MEQSPLNRYPVGHPFYRPPRRKPVPDPFKVEMQWWEASRQLPWDTATQLPHEVEPGMFALWRVHVHYVIPVRLARKQGRDRDGIDWFVERLDDPEPQPRQTPIAGWVLPATRPALYRASWFDLRTCPDEVVGMIGGPADEGAACPSTSTPARNAKRRRKSSNA